MKKLFYRIIPLVIGLGVIGLALNTMFGANTVTYLSTFESHGIIYYKYDIWNYLQNIKNTFTNVSILQLNLITRTWETDGSDMFAMLVNNLAYIADLFIFGINIFMYPIRIIFYIMRITLSIIGLPTIPGTYNGNPMTWLIDLTNKLANLELAYI